MKEIYPQTLKQKVHEHFKEMINAKVSALQTALQDLVETTKNETKSSAGDKYETARAMLQIEQDNVRKQLKEALEQKAAFTKIIPAPNMQAVVTGSLVKTEKTYFFVSVALGKAVIDGITIIALSPQSPLGKKLVGSKTSDVVSLNGTSYYISTIE